MFLANPYFGIGNGNFFAQYGNYQADFFLSKKYSDNILNIAGMNYQPFSELIRIGVENGIVGLGFLIIILWLTLHKVIKSILKFDDVYIWCAILIIIITFCTVSYPFTDITITTIFITCICAINKHEKKLITINLKFPYKCLALIILIIVLSLGTLKIYGIFLWSRASNTIQNISKSGLNRYQEIFPILSNNGSFLYNYGVELALVGEHRKSLGILQRATYYGNSIELYTALGDSYLVSKNLDMAEASYLRAAYMAPKKFLPFEKLLDFYIKTNQWDKAAIIAKTICNKRIKIPSLLINKIKSKACDFKEIRE